MIALRFAVLFVAAAIAASAVPARVQAPEFDPLERFSPGGRTQLTGGAPVVEVPRLHGDDIAIIGAVRTRVADDRFVAWSREITELHRGKYVPLIGRFSRPVRSSDVAALVLDDEELDELKDCRPGRCGLKLSASEIHYIGRAIDAGPAWRDGASAAFRAVMLARAREFEANGFRGTPAYEDGPQAVDPATEFQVLLGRFAGDPLFTPRLARQLRTFRATDPGVESFLYWSKDLLGDAKPIVSITHVSILHGTAGEPTIVAATQIYASHYLNASVSLTALADCPADGSRYLLYVRRTRADVFDGAFGGVIRRIVSRRIRTEGTPLLAGFRDKLERSLPPNAAATHRKP